MPCVCSPIIAPGNCQDSIKNKNIVVFYHQEALVAVKNHYKFKESDNNNNIIILR